MRYIVATISVLFLISIASCGGRIEDINYEYATPVIRTDFTDEAAWKKIEREVTATNSLGFSANVRFVDDRQYSELTEQELLQKISGLDEYGCIFIADGTAMSSTEHHLLVVDPSNPTGETFRVIPSEAWGVENNLSIANMDYDEFYNLADPDSVFRGIK